MPDTEKTKVEALDPQRVISDFPGFIYVCDYDESWTMRYLSDGAQAILGYSADDLIGNRVIAFSDLIHPDDQEGISVSAEKNLADRKPCEYEYRITTASGSEKWLWERSRGIYDESGKVIRIEGYIEDVTARKEVEENLRKSERRLKAAQRFSKVGSWERDLTTNEAWWSDENYRLFGTNAQDQSLAHEAFLERVHPDDRQCLTKAIQHAIQGGDRFDMEYRTMPVDGEVRVIHGQAEVMFDAEGRPTRIYGTSQDITEHVQMEGRLRLSEVHLSDAQRMAKIGNWSRNLVTDELWWSPERYRIAGRTPGTFIPSREAFLAMVHPEDRQRVDGEEMNALASGEPYSIEFRTVLLDGSVRAVHARGETFFDEKGSPVQFAGTVQDITERKEIEESLRKSIDRYDLAVRATNDGIWDWNIQTGEDFFSSRWKEILGYQEDELDPDVETFTALLHPGDRERAWRAVEDHLRDRAPYDLEFRMRHKSGRFVWVHAKGEAVWSDTGEPLRMAGSIRDVTARRATEREVVTIAEQERSRIGRDLHDGLGQELTAISLGLRAHSRSLEQESSRHTQTAQGLTDLTQKAIAETQRVARLLSPVFLSEVGLSASLRSLATEVNMYSRVNCSVQCLEPVRLDDVEIATQLFRIAQESVNNAAKHSGAQNIEIRLGCEGGSLTLEVLDDGSGISYEAHRVEGLGLKSMRYRARMINGELEISRRSEGGTRVVCSLPEVDGSGDGESLEPRLVDQKGDSQQDRFLEPS